MTRLEALFDEFAAAYARGGRPDPAAYLARAGREQQRLGELIDVFLQTVPARAADPTETALIEARMQGEPALLVQRRRLGLGPAEVARALRVSLGLAGGEARLAQRYGELEAGSLDPERVGQRLWEALDRVLGASARLLAGAVPPPPSPVLAARVAPAQGGALGRRKAHRGFALESAAAVPLSRAQPPPDDDHEVDLLFGLA